MVTRASIVSAARAWVGTPYHHQASVKGVGCDCLGLIRGVWRELYVKRAGIKPSGSLLARSYLNWGKKLKQPRRGCIVVLKRGNSTWQGHVAFFDHEEGGRLVCLGGNQSDRVCFAPYARSRLLGFRWPS